MSFQPPAYLPDWLMEMTIGSLSGVDRDRTWNIGDGWSATAEECRTQAGQVERCAPTMKAAATGDSSDQLVAAQKQLTTDLRTNAQRCDSLARECYQTANAGELNDLIVIGSGIALLAQLAVDALMLGGGVLKAALDKARTQTIMRAARAECAARVIASGAQQLTLRAGMNPVTKFALIGAGWGAGFGGAVHYGAQWWQMEKLGHTDHIEWRPVAENTFIGGLAGAFGGAAAMWAAPGIGQLIRRAGGRAWATAGGTVLIGGAAGLAGGVAGAAGGLLFGAPLTWKDLKAAIVTGIGGGIAGTLVQGLGAARTAAATPPPFTTPPTLPTHAPRPEPIPQVEPAPQVKPVLPGELSASALAEHIQALTPDELRMAIDNYQTRTETIMSAFFRGEDVPSVEVIRAARDQHTMVTEHARRLLDDGSTPNLTAIAPDLARLHRASTAVVELAGAFCTGDLPALWDLHDVANRLGELRHAMDLSIVDDVRGALDGWSRRVDDYLTPFWGTEPDPVLTRTLRELEGTLGTFTERAMTGHPDFPAAARRALTDTALVLEYTTTRSRDVERAAACARDLHNLYVEAEAVAYGPSGHDDHRGTSAYATWGTLSALPYNDRPDVRETAMLAEAQARLPSIRADIDTLVAHLAGTDAPPAGTAEPSHQQLAHAAATLDDWTLQQNLKAMEDAIDGVWTAFMRGDDSPFTLGYQSRTEDIIRTLRDHHTLATEQARRIVATWDRLGPNVVPENHGEYKAIKKAVRQLMLTSSNAVCLAGVLRPDQPALFEKLQRFPEHLGTLGHHLMEATRIGPGDILHDIERLSGLDLNLGAMGPQTPEEGAAALRAVDKSMRTLADIVEPKSGASWSQQMEAWVAPEWQKDPNPPLAQALRGRDALSATLVELDSLPNPADHPNFTALARTALTDLSLIAEYQCTRVGAHAAASEAAIQLDQAITLVSAGLGRHSTSSSALQALIAGVEAAQLLKPENVRNPAAREVAQAQFPAIRQEVAALLAELSVPDSAITVDALITTPPMDHFNDAAARIHANAVAALHEFRNGQPLDLSNAALLAQDQQATMWYLATRCVDAPEPSLIDAQQVRDAANDLYNLAGILGADVDESTNLHTLRQHAADLVGHMEHGRRDDARVALDELRTGYLESPHRGTTPLDGYLPARMQPDPALVHALAAREFLSYSLPSTVTAETRGEYLKFSKSALQELVTAAHYYTTRTTDLDGAVRVVRVADQLATLAALARDPHAEPVSPFTRLLASLSTADPFLMRDIGIAAFERNQDIANAVTRIADQHSDVVANLNRDLPLTAATLSAPPAGYDHAALADWARDHDNSRLREVASAYEIDASRLLVTTRTPDELINHARAQQALAWELLHRIATDPERPHPASDSYADITAATSQLEESPLMLDLHQLSSTVENVFALADAAGVNVRTADGGLSAEIGWLGDAAIDSANVWSPFTTGIEPSPQQRADQFRRLTSISRALDRLRTINPNWSDHVDAILARPLPFD